MGSGGLDCVSLKVPVSYVGKQRDRAVNTVVLRLMFKSFVEDMISVKYFF
jgi:hypothetical protein